MSSEETSNVEDGHQMLQLKWNPMTGEVQFNVKTFVFTSEIQIQQKKKKKANLWNEKRTGVT